MVQVMRTTVDIPDPIYRKLKAKAALHGASVRATILQAVSRDLEVSRPKKRIRLPLIPGKEKRLLNLTNEQIDELLFG